MKKRNRDIDYVINKKNSISPYNTFAQEIYLD